MRQNPERRQTLLDSAIEVLAAEGSRGLTLRTVDKAAGVPIGTTTNYFTNRDDLLSQVMLRIRERLTPDPAQVEQILQAGPTPDTVRTMLRWLIARMRSDRSSHLAMLEMRLEATRRPELQAEMTGFLSSDLTANIDFHLASGLPGDRTGALVVYLAMWGLIVDDLTVPDLLVPYGVDTLIDAIVDRALV